MKLEDTDWYKNDAIGLKTLNEAGKVQFKTIVGEHMTLSMDDINNTMIPFLL